MLSTMSRRKQSPNLNLHKAQTPTNGRARTVSASVHRDSVCCEKASGRAILSAVTAGQSSAASWVSIGHGSTVHYHMGVATSSLLEKCFQLSKVKKARKVPGMPVQDCRLTWGNVRAIIKKKMFTRLKAESLQREKVRV